MKEPIKAVTINCEDTKTTKDEKDEDYSKSWPQVLAILIASIISFTSGLHVTWTSPAIPQIISDKVNYDIDLEEASYFMVITPIAAISSSFMFSKINNLIGRKYTVLFMAVPYSLAFVIIGGSTSLWMLYFARFLVGVGDACLFSTLPSYICEITTPKVRGRWGNTMVFFIFLGEFMINVIGSFFNVQHTAYICLVFPAVFVISFIFMPESPYYLITKERYDDARSALKTLRRVDNVEDELSGIKKDVERQLSESGTWKDLFYIKSNRKALFAGVFMRVSQQLSGAAVFGCYCQYIFIKAGASVSAEDASMIFSGLCALLIFFSAFTVDRFGRQKSFKYSALTSGIVLLVTSVYFFLEQTQPDVNLKDWHWVPFIGLILYAFTFCAGMGIIPTISLGELFSESVKGKGLCVLNIVFGILISTVTKFFQVLETRVGIWCPFLVFAGCCFVTTVLNNYFVPETKGRTLEEIQQALKGNDKKKSNT